MLLLAFNVGEERYAIDCREVVEVVPRVDFKSLPKAPDYVVGLFRYRGAAVPAVDLRQLMQGTPCRRLLSTRIIVIRYQPPGEPERPLGLLGEQVTSTFVRKEEDFAPSGVTVEDAPYLGEVADDDEGLIQCLTVERLLPESVRRLLYAEGAEKT